jgi:hypothetical protein
MQNQPPAPTVVDPATINRQQPRSYQGISKFKRGSFHVGIAYFIFSQQKKPESGGEQGASKSEEKRVAPLEAEDKNSSGRVEPQTA